MKIEPSECPHMLGMFSLIVGRMELLPVGIRKAAETTWDGRLEVLLRHA